MKKATVWINMGAALLVFLILTCCRRGELKILQVVPSGKVDTEVTQISITFAKPMVPLAAYDVVKGKSPVSLSCDFPGEWRWVNANTLKYFFNEPVPPSTRCTYEIKAGLKSESGATLKTAAKYEFETRRIKVVASTPYGHDKLVKSEYLTVTGLEERIAVTFNQPVDARSLAEFGYFQYGANKVKLRVMDIPKADQEAIEKLKDRFVFTEKIGSDVYAIYVAQRRDMSRTYIVKPEQPLPKNMNYQLMFAPGLRPMFGTLSSDRQFNLYYRTYPTFSISSTECSDNCPGGCNPEGDMCVSFATSFNLKDAMNRFKIEPAVKWGENQLENSEYAANSICFHGPFRVQTEYVITIPEGFQDVWGQTIEGERTVTFRTGDYNAELWTAQGMGIMEAKEGIIYPLRVRNMKTVHLRMKAFGKNEAIPFYNRVTMGAKYLQEDNRDDGGDYDYYDDGYYGSGWPGSANEDLLAGENNVKEHDLKFTVPKNQLNWEPLDIEKILGGSALGKLVYFDMSKPDPCCVWDLECRPFYKTSAFETTNLGVTGKLGYFSSLVWVTSLSDGKPVPDANLEMRNDRNQVLWKGKTDASGLAYAPGKGQLYELNDKGRPKKSKFWFVAEKDGDVSLINNKWNSGIGPWEFNLLYANFAYQENLIAYAVIERPIYRPGDSVRYKLIVRSEGERGLTRPVKDTIYVKVTDNRGELVHEREGKLTGSGSFAGEIQLSPGASLGRYTMDIGYVKGRPYERASFRVEEYRKPNFEIKPVSEKEQYYPKQKIQYKVTGRYHFGAPVMNEKVHYVLSSVPAPFQPRKLTGYSSRNFYTPEAEEYASGGERVLEESQFKLDGQGQASYATNAPDKLERGPVHYVLEVKMQDKDARWVADRARALVHPGAFYLGLKPQSWGVEAGQAIHFKLMAVTPDEKTVAGARVALKLIRREWLTVREKRVAGFYGYQSKIQDTLVESKSAVTAETPIEVEFKPGKGGYYFVVASASDGAGNTVSAAETFYAWGGGYVSWERYDHDRIDIVPEKTEYMPGETARILIKNPYDGATGIVTVERKGVLRHQVIEVKNGAELVEVPIKPEDTPNVFVSVVLVKGRVSREFNESGFDLGKPSMKIGYTSLRVLDPATRLKITVTPNQETYQPGDKCTLKIQAANNAGKGVKTELALAAVDEALLQLVSDRPYHPFDHFYAERSLDLDSADSRVNIIGRRHWGKKGEISGGGGGFSSGEFRSKFVDSAFWQAALLTDAKGVAEVTFTLPDNLTSFHIFAVGNDEAQKFGTGEKTFQVKKPIMVMPSLPRFLMEKDQFLAGAIIHNQTETVREINVSLEVENAKRTGPAVQRVTIKPGEAAEVRFPVVAGTGGRQAVFKYRAVSGELKDAVMTQTPVEFHAPFDVYATYANSEKSAHESVLLPKTVRRDVGHLEIGVASSMVGSLEGAFAYLYYYPYDCLEQNTSKAMMFMLYDEFRDRLKLDYLNGEKARKYVTGVWLTELGDYQRYSGSFDFWKIKGMYDQPWLTAYVTLVLQHARARGYDVPEGIYNRAIRYLEDTVNYNRWPPYYTFQTGEATRAFILLALARNGSIKPAMLEPSIKMADDLPPFALACLLEAYEKARGKDASYKSLRQKLFNHAEISSGKVLFDEILDDGYTWILYSELRSNAVILCVLDKIEPNGEFNAKLMRHLVESMKMGRWRNTQENVFALWAITDYLRVAEKRRPNFKIEARLKDKEVFTAAFKDWQSEPVRKRIPLSELPPGEKLKLGLDKSGSGRMYYRLELKSAPKIPENRALNAGMQVVRRYIPVEAQGSNPSFERGKLVKVVLKLKVPRERHFVVVSDPLPAGFEAINYELQTADRASKKFMNEQSENLTDAQTQNEWRYYYKRHWCRFVEMRDDRVVLYSEYLPAGEYTFVYMARATSSGKFLAPATRIEEMYEPETYGKGLFETVEVK